MSPEQPTLVEQLRISATGADDALSVVLRRTKVLGVKLKNEALSRWVDLELNGYPRPAELPDYRVLTTAVRAELSGPFQSAIRNADVPESLFPPDLRHSIIHAQLTQPVGELEDLALSKKHALHSSLPPEIVATYIAENVFDDYNAVAAWRVISTSQLKGVLDTIRNRVLTFALEIEMEDPRAGEPGNDGDSAIPSDRVDALVLDTIYGGVRR